MIFRTPAARISFSLVLLTISLLLIADVIGFIPDRTRSLLEARKSLSESLAIQFTAAAERNDLSSIRSTLKSIVERNGDIKSAALRVKNGQLLAMAGDHLAHWKPPQDGKSTATQVQVPMGTIYGAWLNCVLPPSGSMTYYPGFATLS